jgi:hypothetical protein
MQYTYFKHIGFKTISVTFMYYMLKFADLNYMANVEKIQKLNEIKSLLQNQNRHQ